VRELVGLEVTRLEDHPGRVSEMRECEEAHGSGSMARPTGRQWSH